MRTKRWGAAEKTDLIKKNQEVLAKRYHEPLLRGNYARMLSNGRLGYVMRETKKGWEDKMD